MHIITKISLVLCLTLHMAHASDCQIVSRATELPPEIACDMTDLFPQEGGGRASRQLNADELNHDQAKEVLMRFIVRNKEQEAALAAEKDYAKKMEKLAVAAIVVGIATSVSNIYYSFRRKQ